MKVFAPLFFIISFSILTSCSNSNSTVDEGSNSPASSAPILSYNIVATYPHDTSSFIQGLAFYKGKLYEGTGMAGSSKLMQVDLPTGKAIQTVKLDSTLFGEGVTILNDTVY